MENMKHKGYEGTVEYDAEDHILHGHVLGISGVVGYEGTSVAELEADFRAGVDGYLARCAAEGIDPVKPCSGKFMTRMPPELHRRAAQCASAEGMSLNQFLVQLVEQATQPLAPTPKTSRSPRKKTAARAHS